MNKYIPYEKLSKKEKRKIDLKFRNNWGSINPITKTIPNKKYIQNNFIRLISYLFYTLV